MVQSTAGGQLWVRSVIQLWGNISNSNLSDVKKSTLSTLMDDTKLEKAADTLEDRVIFQKEPKSGEMNQAESHDAE